MIRTDPINWISSFLHSKITHFSLFYFENFKFARCKTQSFWTTLKLYPSSLLVCLTTGEFSPSEGTLFFGFKLTGAAFFVAPPPSDLQESVSL